MIANRRDKWFTRACWKYFDFESSEIPLNLLKFPEISSRLQILRPGSPAPQRFPSVKSAQPIDPIDPIGPVKIAGPMTKSVSVRNPVRISRGHSRTST